MASNLLAFKHLLSSDHLDTYLAHGDNCDAMTGSLNEDAGKLRQRLNSLPQPQIEPPLIVVSGLPGTGKSFFCRKLVERLPFLILSSDTLRRILFSSPRYTESENKRLFPTCHALIEELLRKGIPVIFDATNLLDAPPGIPLSRREKSRGKAHPGLC